MDVRFETVTLDHLLMSTPWECGNLAAPAAADGREQPVHLGVAGGFGAPAGDPG